MENEVATKPDLQVIPATTPDSLIERAIDNGADVETVGRLLELKEQYEAQEAKKAFSKAMSEFQVDKPVLPKCKAISFARKSGQGGSTSTAAAYRFCPLDVMAQLLKGPLEVHGLSYTWEGFTRDGKEGQRCIIRHKLGHSEATEMVAPADTSGNKNSIQAIGSTASYLQRYTLKAALGLVEVDDDDDGQLSGDAPLVRLIAHNAVVFDHLNMLLEVRAMMAMGEYRQAVKAIYELSQEEFTAIWLAPSEGGWFTTKEREQIRSDEWVAARDAYFEEKNK